MSKMTQLSLCFDFGFTRESLEGYLSRSSGRQVLLTVTENSTRMVSLRMRGGDVHLRLHRIFLDSGPEVLSELVQFIKRKGGPSPAVRRFLREKACLVKESAPRPLKAEPIGRHYDLGVIFERVNLEYFNGEIVAPITWGKKSPKRAVRRRTLGSYSFSSKSIRINPVLDSPRVPEFYLEFIVYHEMLHASLGVKESGGRRTVHSREFRAREREFREYAKAIEWEKAKGPEGPSRGGQASKKEKGR